MRIDILIIISLGSNFHFFCFSLSHARTSWFCSFHPAVISWAGPRACLPCASHSPPHQCTYAHGRGQLPFASSSGHISKLHASAMGADRSSTVSNETKLWKSNLKQLQTTNSPSWTPQNLERIVGSQNYQNKKSTWSSNWAFKRDYAGETLKAGILSWMNLVNDDYSYQPSLNSQISLRFNRNKEQKADSMANEKYYLFKVSSNSMKEVSS